MSNTSRPERVGHIVCVHFLHLNTIDLEHRRVTHPASDNFLYTVEAKPRPMVVIGPNGEQTFGVQWYWVLKLTRAGGGHDAARRRGCVRLGDLLHDGTTSYAERRPYSYPENLFEAMLRALDPVDFQSVLSIVGVKPGGPLRL